MFLGEEKGKNQQRHAQTGKGLKDSTLSRLWGRAHTSSGVRLVGRFHAFYRVLDNTHKGGKAGILKLARPPGLQHSEEKARMLKLARPPGLQHSEENALSIHTYVYIYIYNI